MSITLSIPPMVVHEARTYAESHGTSLNAMIREYLERITMRNARKAEAAKNFRRLADSLSAQLAGSTAYRFQRSDAYDREN